MSEPFCVLAIDIGSSSLHVGLFTAQGEPLGECVRRYYALDTAPNGEAMLDAERIFAYLFSALDEVQAHCRVKAVGISTFWHSLTGIDAQQEITLPIITWADSRAAHEAAALKYSGVARHLHALTGCPVHSSFWPARLRWLANEQQAAFARTRHWLSLSDLLFLRLFGTLSTSLSMASGTGLLDSNRRCWSPLAMSLAHIKVERLPDISDAPCQGLRSPWAARWPAFAAIPWYPAWGDGACSNIAKKLNYGYTDFMSYSIDFRRRILSIKKHEGLSIRETAKRFHIGTTTIVRWTKQIDARPATSRQRKIDKSALERDVEQYPDAYQRERAERFGVCQMAICKALKKLQLTYKKKTLRHPKVDEDARQAFQQKIQQYKNEGKAIVLIDESGFDHDTPRTHGYSLLGKRCYGLKDWGARKRTNVIGAMHGTVLFAVCLFECNINSDIFYSWVTESLIPELPKKSVTVMDNASFHIRNDIQKSIIDAGHQLEYLPVYSPDLNPIEHKWSQAKRKKMETGCDIDSLFSVHMM